MYAKAVTVAKSPNQALLIGWHELAVGADQPGYGIDGEQGAEHGARGLIDCALDPAQVNEDAQVRCGLREGGELWPCGLNGGRDLSRVCHLLDRVVEPGPAGVLDPERVAG